MKKHHILSALTFLGIFVFAAITAWITGYNFDKRGDNVAFVFFITTLFASMLAGFVFAVNSGDL